MFRGAFASRQCLVPADHFYERKAIPDGKQPSAIDRRNDSPWLSQGCGRAGEILPAKCCEPSTIATTAANDDMAALHDRMPVMLNPGAWPLWLDEQRGDHAELLAPAAPALYKSGRSAGR